MPVYSGLVKVTQLERMKTSKSIKNFILYLQNYQVSGL